MHQEPIKQSQADNSGDNLSYEDKLARLKRLLTEMGSVLVGFSGGVDSSVLLHGAKQVLGPAAKALIADSPSLPRNELHAARELAKELGAELIEVSTDELSNSRYAANTGDRCYWCKHTLFEEMTAWARNNNVRWLAFGEITDDLQDDRPGARAAQEFGVRAPLREAGLSKEDVRAYARSVGLPVAEKPQMACLASRIPVGTSVTAERLLQVERAEASLRGLGLLQVRVRHHGSKARVEVGAEDLDSARVQLERIREELSLRGFASLELGIYGRPWELLFPE